MIIILEDHLFNYITFEVTEHVLNELYMAICYNMRVNVIAMKYIYN